MIFKRHYPLLFIVFIFFVFLLIFPEISLAWNVYYTTECGEQIKMGSCSNICCETCCNDDCYCCDYCTVCSCENKEWDEYRASTADCGPVIQKRHCHVEHSGSCCGSNESCSVSCTAWENCEDCGSWRKADTTASCSVTKASLTRPNCTGCRPECIDAPLNPGIYSPPRYYDNSIYPPDPWNPTSTHQMDQNDIYLPVKIDWDDVRGWKSGWQTNLEKKVVEKCSVGSKGCSADYPINLSNCRKECRNTCLETMRDEYPPKENLYQYRQDYYGCLNTCETTCENNDTTSTSGCSATCPSPDKCYPESEFIKSYVIRIEGEMKECETGKEITTYTGVLDKSEWVQPCSCFFKPNRTYKWYVKACCGSDGTNCGTESNWTFKSNAAPEPLFPYDLDWNGPERVINVLKENIEKLKWCEIDDKEEWQGADDKKYKYYKTSLYEAGEWKEYYKPLSYKLLIYYSEEDLCHPELEAGGKCYDEILKRDYPYESFPPFEFWDRNNAFFTKLTPYAWQVSACSDYYGRDCTDYGQLWRFEGENFTLDKPRCNAPPNDKGKPITLPLTISWISPYAMSWQYEVSRVDTGETISGTTTVYNVGFTYPQLGLNALYKWRVKPCWDYEAKECENFWSEYFYFKTTLAPPELELPADNTSSTFPIPFDWEDVPYAEYYILQISSTSSISNFKSQLVAPEKTIPKDSQTLVDFSPPNFIPEKTYYWRVKTCLRDFCGEWSEIKEFGTLLPAVPTNPRPSDGGEIFSFLPYDPVYKPSLSWSPSSGAKFYQISIGYGTENATCTDSLGKTIINKIVSQSSLSLNSDLKCEGKYSWTLRACLDNGCQYASDWAGPWSFNYTIPKPPPEVIGGFVPCNRWYNNPDTPWDDTKPCEFQHFFYLLINVLDFVLWKLGLLILVLLVIATALILYLAPWVLPEQPQPLINVKSLWRAAGIGYFIIFFAWAIINLILVLIGYQFQFFGKWWQVSF